MALRDPLYAEREAEFYWLWIIATTTYGVGDIVTTVAFFYFHPTLTEANLLVRWAMMTFDLAGIIALKLASFVLIIAFTVVLAHLDTHPLLYYTPPAVLAVLGAYLTAWNLIYLIGFA